MELRDRGHAHTQRQHDQRQLGHEWRRCVERRDTATLTLDGSTISGNSATNGGGVYNYGMATLTNCTISDNSATYGGGGGVWDKGTAATLAIEGCTISGNYAVGGGGLYNDGAMTLTDSTISGNSARPAAAACGTPGPTLRSHSKAARSAATTPQAAAGCTTTAR